jgi:hypothetical protein
MTAVRPVAALTAIPTANGERLVRADNHRMTRGNNGKKARVLPTTWPLDTGTWLGHPCTAARMNQCASQMFRSPPRPLCVNRSAMARLARVTARQST